MEGRKVYSKCDVNPNSCTCPWYLFCYKLRILAMRSSRLSSDSATVSSAVRFSSLFGIVYATVIPTGRSGTGPEAAFSSSSVVSDTNSMPLH